MRRGKDLPEAERPDNVTPLRRDAEQEPVPAPAPAAEVQTEFPDLQRSAASDPVKDTLPTETIERPADFMSPFEEDELDVPTFIRRRDDDDEEDRDEPAFLRRSAD
jgi:hypothetical protein